MEGVYANVQRDIQTIQCVNILCKAVNNHPSNQSGHEPESCSASFSPRIFEQKRDCSQSNCSPILEIDYPRTQSGKFMPKYSLEILRLTFLIAAGMGYKKSSAYKWPVPFVLQVAVEFTRT